MITWCIMNSSQIADTVLSYVMYIVSVLLSYAVVFISCNPVIQDYITGNGGDQSYDCPTAGETSLQYMGNNVHELTRNYNKTRQNDYHCSAVRIFGGIYELCVWCYMQFPQLDQYGIWIIYVVTGIWSKDQYIMTLSKDMVQLKKSKCLE